MTAIWLKLLHIASLAVWAGGLVALPSLKIDGPDLSHAEWVRRHRFSRFCYDALVSPAAVLAVGSGTALIFVSWVPEPWMFAKLVAVAAMVVVHMLIGRTLDRSDETGHLKATPILRAALLAGGIAAISAVLWLVLEKPQIDTSWMPDWLLRDRGQDGLPFVSGASSSSSDGTLTPT